MQDKIIITQKFLYSPEGKLGDITKIRWGSKEILFCVKITLEQLNGRNFTFGILSIFNIKK
jgi:hypothetical protein